MGIRYRLKSGLGGLVIFGSHRLIVCANGEEREMALFFYEGDDEPRALAKETFEWLYELAEQPTNIYD